MLKSLSFLQLRMEALIIGVAGFSGWIIGNVFVWGARHVQILLVLVFILFLSGSLDYFGCNVVML